MTFLKSTLCASVLATLGLLSAEKAIAQSYAALSVTTEGPHEQATCSFISNNGTVACTETTILSPPNFQYRITFDNPFLSSAGRDAPTIRFPMNQGVNVFGLNVGSVVAGTVSSGGTLSAFAASGSGQITLSAIANQFARTESVNDQGWMVLTSREWNRYLRVPSASSINSGTLHPITCSDERAPHTVTKVNRNGLIIGSCWRSGTPAYRDSRPVVWGWWDLSHPVDLTAFLPATIDLGFGLVTRTDADLVNCNSNDISENADVFLITCDTTRGSYLGLRVSFVVSPSGSRQLLPVNRYDSWITWVAVNAQGCAVGDHRTSLDSGLNELGAMIACNSKAGALPLNGLIVNAETTGFSDTRTRFVRQAVDINDQGHILVNDAPGMRRDALRPLVLVPIL